MIDNRGIELEIVFYENLKRKIKKRMSYYPEGRICFKYEHNKHRPYIGRDNKQKYLNAENKLLISKLMKKRIDNITLKYIDINLKILKEIYPKYKSIDYILGEGVVTELEETIGKGFKVSDFLRPANTTYHTNPYSNNFRTDQKIHTTPSGIAVRSRAELVIATFLEMKGIDYTYEKPVKLFLRTVAPDFTIKRKSDGKTIIWEHFGMMDDPEYYESRMELLSDYHHGGWLPYDNFIATFGEKNSPIDMTIIETICETMLK